MEPQDINSFVPGSVGPLIDELPLLTQANVKPYIIAILLHRGAVRFHEIIANIQPHCPEIDTKLGGYPDLPDDLSRLELLVSEVLGEMVGAGLLKYIERHHQKDLWVLNTGKNNCNLPTIINWVSSSNAQLPKHLLIEMAKINLRNTRLGTDENRSENSTSP